MPNGMNDNEKTILYKTGGQNDQTVYAGDPAPGRLQQNLQQQRPPQQVRQQPIYQQQRPPQQNYRQPVYPQQQRAPQQGYQQQMYQQPAYTPPPPQYIPPQNGMNGGRKNNDDKGSPGVTVLIIIIILLIIALIGVGILMYVNSSDSGGSGKKSSSNTDSSSDAEYITERPSAGEETVTNKPSEDEKVIVPELRGSDYRSAESTLRQAGLGSRIEFQFSDTISENVVISQSEPAGTEVDEGTVIVLTVSQGKSEVKSVEVPNLRGLSLEDAVKILENNNLFATTTYEESATIAEGIVIDQGTAPGTKVNEGSRIPLIVSSGKNSQTTTAPTTVSPDTHKTGKVNTKETDLNVRKGPSSSDDIIGTLPKDSTVEIVGTDGNWYKIIYKSGYGYVSKDYIKLQN